MTITRSTWRDDFERAQIERDDQELAIVTEIGLEHGWLTPREAEAA